MPVNKGGKSKSSKSKAVKQEVSENPVTAKIIELEGKLEVLKKLTADIVAEKDIASAHTPTFLAKVIKRGELSQEISRAIPNERNKHVNKDNLPRIVALKEEVTASGTAVGDGLLTKVKNNITAAELALAKIKADWERVAVKTSAALAAIDEQLPIFVETAKSYLSSSIEDESPLSKTYYMQRAALAAEIDKIQNRQGNTTDVETKRKYLHQVNQMGALINKRDEFRAVVETSNLYEEADLGDKDALYVKFHAQMIRLEQSMAKLEFTAEVTSIYEPILTALSEQVEARKLVLDKKERAAIKLIETRTKKVEAALESQSTAQLLLNFLPQAARELAMQLLNPEAQAVLAQIAKQDATLALDNPIVQAVSKALAVITNGSAESSALVVHSGAGKAEESDKGMILALPEKDQRALVASALMDFAQQMQPSSTGVVASATGVSTSTQMAIVASVLGQLAERHNSISAASHKISDKALVALSEGFKVIDKNLKKLESGEGQIFSLIAQVGNNVHVAHFSLAELAKNPEFFKVQIPLWAIKIGLSQGGQIITNVSSLREAAALSLMQGKDIRALTALKQGADLMAITDSLIAAAASNNAGTIKQITGGQVTESSLALVEQESRMSVGSGGALSSGAKAAGGASGLSGKELTDVLRTLIVVAGTTTYFVSPAGQKALGDNVGHQPLQIDFNDVAVLEQAGKSALLDGIFQIQSDATLQIQGAAAPLQIKDAAPLELQDAAPLELQDAATLQIQGAAAPLQIKDVDPLELTDGALLSGGVVAASDEEPAPAGNSVGVDDVDSAPAPDEVGVVQLSAASEELSAAALEEQRTAQKILDAQLAAQKASEAAANEAIKKERFITWHKDGIKPIIDVLRQEIVTNGKHHSATAQKGATDLLIAVDLALNSYIENLSKFDTKLCKDLFKTACESAMTDAKPKFKHDVEWGTYLLNQVKRLLNFVFGPVMRKGGFFDVKESESTASVKKAEAAIGTELAKEYSEKPKDGSGYGEEPSNDGYDSAAPKTGGPSAY